MPLLIKKARFSVHIFYNNAKYVLDPVPYLDPKPELKIF